MIMQKINSSINLKINHANLTNHITGKQIILSKSKARHLLPDLSEKF